MRVFQITCFMICAVGALRIPAFAQAQIPSAVLSVQDVHFDPTISDIRVVVTNIGQRRITACALLVLSQQMTEDYFSSIGQDAKLRAPRPPGFGGILPGESVEFLFPSRGDQAPTAEVNAIVFDDRTAIGDETQIAYLFRKRLAYASEWQRWAPSMKPERFRNMAADALHTAKNELVTRLQLTNSSATDAATATGETGARMELISILKQVEGANSAAVLDHLQERVASLGQHSTREGGMVK